MAKYDIEAVRSACAGAWPEVLAALSKLPINTFDGTEQTCPKCGGTTRFRFTDTKKSGKGGAICHHCFKEKNGDGFAVLQWLLGTDFKEVIRLVAEYKGIKPEKFSRNRADPAKDLVFLPWNSTAVGLWCKKKSPIKPEALQAVDARCATYRGEYRVIAIPLIGHSMDPNDIVGWILYRSDGKELPVYDKTGKVVEWKKVKITAGSDKGIIGSLSGDVVWKVEGPTDLLAHLSAGLPANHSAFTTGSGASEIPLSWICKAVAGKTVFVLHDADEPGQNGATYATTSDGSRRPGWSPKLAEYAFETRNVCLPYPIEKNHGQDLRDFYSGGGTFDSLMELANNGKPFSGELQSAEDGPYIARSDTDPQRLARVNLKQYEDKHGGRLVYWRSEWWKWKAGRYRRIDNEELRAKVWYSITQEFERIWLESKDKDQKVKEVTQGLVNNVIGAMKGLSVIPSSAPMPCLLTTREQPHYVSTLNGIMNLEAVFNGEEFANCLLPHTSDWFSTFRLNYKFDPNSDCPLWLDYLDYVMEGDIQRINLLQEWAGYLLTGSNPYQKFLALEGEGGNGKTVYFAGITAMLGSDNVSNVPLENFADRFALGCTIGKAANISGDVGEVDQVAEGTLKQFTGGEPMMFDRKGIEPIMAIPTAKLMCAWNSRPRFKDRSWGTWRRLLIVPFNRRVSEDRRVHGMDNPQWWIDQGEVSGILMWAIVGLDRLRTHKDFTDPDLSRDALREYRAEANPASEFLTDFLQPGEGSIDCNLVYKLYKNWCHQSGYKPLGSGMFGKEVKRFFPQIDKKRIRDGKNLHWKYLNIEFSVEEIFSMSVEGEQKTFL